LGVQLCIILRVIYICKKYVYIYIYMYYFFIFFSGLYTYECGNYDWLVIYHCGYMIGFNFNMI
jgi:hypothetical protein